jgi:hypothetical protein
MCVYSTPVLLSSYNVIIVIKESLFSINNVKGVRITFLSVSDLLTKLVILLNYFVLYRLTNKFVKILNSVAQIRMSCLLLNYYKIRREYLSDFSRNHY